MLNVLHRDPDAIRHFWGSELFYAPTDSDQARATSPPWSRWNMFDLTPEGRPVDWEEQIVYE